MWNRLTSGGCKLHSITGAQSIGRRQKTSLTHEKGPDQTLQGLRVVKSLDFILAQVWISIFSVGLHWIRFEILKGRFSWNTKGKANKYKNTKQTYKSIKMNSSQVQPRLQSQISFAHISHRQMVHPNLSLLNPTKLALEQPTEPLVHYPKHEANGSFVPSRANLLVFTLGQSCLHWDWLEFLTCSFLGTWRSYFRSGISKHFL